MGTTAADVMVQSLWTRRLASPRPAPAGPLLNGLYDARLLRSKRRGAGVQIRGII